MLTRDKLRTIDRKDQGRSSPTRPIGILVACAIAILSLLGCDPYIHISGIVKNSHGAPVPNVDVTLAQGQRWMNAPSAEDGKFDLGMVYSPSKKLTLSLTRDGYQPSSRTFHSRGGLTTLDVTLQELPEPTVGQVRKLRIKGLNARESRDLAELMCQQLPNAAAFPMKSFLSGDDVHDTLVLLSGFAQPCLVDHLADSTWMPDSRSEPLADFHAGDAALWILSDAGLDWDGVITPLLDPKKAKSIGVFEYFDWVNKRDHRKVVQQSVRLWLQQHPNCCGSERDFGDTEIVPVYKITPQRFAELQQAWTKLQPGMDESLARRILGAPDAVADPEHLDGIMDLNRFEKSAEFYFVENHTGKGGKFDFRRRDPLRDRYVIVFYSGNGKFARAFSNVRELPPLYPQSEKRWSAMIAASQTEMQKEAH
jgi:hypothetical protein